MKLNRRSLGIVFCSVSMVCCCGTFSYAFYWLRDWAYYLNRERVYSGTNFTKLAFPGSAACVAFSKDSKYLVAGVIAFTKRQGSSVRVWDLETGLETHIESFETLVRSIAFHPDGKKILIATSNELDGTPGIPQPAQIAVYEFPSFRLLEKTEVGEGIVKDGAKFSPDGKLIAVLKKDTFKH